MIEELGLRARKKLERRRCIEAAAIDLIEASGYDGTTIDDIAARADIAPRTFFYYFPTKEDVVLADYAARLERITEELRQRPLAEPPWTALRNAFVTVGADYTSQRDELVRRFVIMADNPSVYARSLQLQAGWEDALADVLTARSGNGNDDVLPRLMASAALACMRSSLRHWLLTGHHTELPALFENCFDRLARGLGENRFVVVGDQQSRK
ncbi:TetR family transcriptional regulator [soil metagenome]